MKIFIVVFVLIFHFSGMVYGQDSHSKITGPFTVTLDGGMTLSKLSNDGFNILGDLYGNMELSYMTGAELEYAITPAVRVRSGVKFVRLGGKSEPGIITDREGRELDYVNFVTKLSYVEIPLLLTYVVKRLRYHPYLASGATVGFLRSSGLEFDPTPEYAIGFEDTPMIPINDVAFGISFAAGVRVPVRGSFGVDVGGTYNLELTNQLDTTIDRLIQKTRSWRFVFGLYLAI